MKISNIGLAVLSERFDKEKEDKKENQKEFSKSSSMKVNQGSRAVISGLKNQNKNVVNHFKNNAMKPLGISESVSYLNETAQLKITENIEQSSMTYKKNVVNPVTDPFTGKKGAKQSAVKLGVLNKISQQNESPKPKNGIVKTKDPELIKAMNQKYKIASKLLQQG